MDEEDWDGWEWSGAESFVEHGVVCERSVTNWVIGCKASNETEHCDRF